MTAMALPNDTPSTPWDPIVTHRMSLAYDGSKVSIGACPKDRSSRVFVRVLGQSYSEMTSEEARELAAALLEAIKIGEETWPESVYPPIEPEPGSEEWRAKRSAARRPTSRKK